MRFLESLARALLESDGNIRDTAVVLPSMRAGVHLRMYLAQAAGKPLWSPDLMEPSAFVSRVAGFRIMDPTEAMLRLHDCAQATPDAMAEPLHEFMQWAPTTLRDFSEADAHLLELDSLYRDLRAYHEIEAWSFLGTADLSPTQRLALERWRQMGLLHRAFGARCRELRAGTYGLAARIAAEQAGTAAWQPTWSKVWFAGLNAMDPALLSVAAALKARGIGVVAWDTDLSYLDDARHEAGHFLRKAISLLGPGTARPTNAIAEKPRLVEAVACSNKAAMARYAAQWVMALDTEQRNSAVIVLADEQLLMPLLEGLPENAGPVNVTMGLPISELPASNLEQAWFNLFEHRDSRGFFVRADFEALATHPFLHEGEATRDLLAALSGPAVSMETILDAASGMQAAEEIRDAFQPIPNGTGHHFPLRGLHAWALRISHYNSDAREQLFALARSRDELDHQLLALRGEIPDPLSYRALRNRTLQGTRLPLHGDPLAGLQVMGMLETRALDHDHVLVLGANEGALSGKEPALTWIPHQIRRRHGLPLPTEAEAITSYHAHRLLHAAERIALAYTTSDQDKDRSRFIAQWKHAFMNHGATRFLQRNALAPLVRRADSAITVAKSPETLRKLHSMAAKGFSPSALGKWLRCPLDFHAQYILGLHEAPKTDGLLATNDIGSAVHSALEALFSPMLGKRLEPDALTNAASMAHTMLLVRLIGAGQPAEALNTGRNRLVIEMASSALKRFLKAEAKRMRADDSILVAAEKRHSAVLAQGTRLSGIIDRIDSRHGMLHVLDIKTGAVEAGKLKINLQDGDPLTADMHLALQLICYAILCFASEPGLESLRAGLVPLRQPAEQGAHWLLLDGEPIVKRQQLPALEALVQRIVDEILHPDVPFTHRKGATNCLACIH